MNFASTETSFRISEFVKKVTYKEDKDVEAISISEFAKKLKEDGRITEACLRLDDEREVEELAEILKREDCSLERLSLSDESPGLDLVDIKQFFEALGSGKCSLCSLKLVNCKISYSINMMVEGLNRCRLRELTLSNKLIKEISTQGTISTQGMKELIRRVPMLRFFAGLWIDAATTKGVAEAIREGYCVLETLKLELVPDEGIYAVVKAIGTRVTQLRSLDLSDSTVGNEGANSLAQAIMRGCCPSLEELCLQCCRIEVEGICSLGEAIGSTVTMLRSLDLSSNKVGERGSKSLAEAITKGACVLRELHLGGAELGSEGICSIVKALTKGHSDLHTLDLSFNELSDYDEWPKTMPIIEIREALKSKHCRLRELILYHCGIGDKDMNLIVDGLSHTPCKLQNIDISNNCITVSHTPCKLQNIDISNNCITDKGVQKLANALQTGQCSLQNLDLSDNLIGREGIKQLRDALKNAKSRGILKIKVLLLDEFFNLVEELDCLEYDSYDSEDMNEDEALAPPTSNVIIATSTSTARDDISFANTQDEFKGLSHKGKKPRHIKKEDVPYNEFITVWDPSSLEKENMDKLPPKMHFSFVNKSLTDKLKERVQQVYQRSPRNHEVRKRFYLAFAYENCKRALTNPGSYEVNWADLASEALKYSETRKGRPKRKKGGQPDGNTNELSVDDMIVDEGVDIFLKQLGLEDMILSDEWSADVVS